MSEPDLVEQTDVGEQEEQVIPENQVEEPAKSEVEASESLGFENDKIIKREEILLQLDEKFLTGELDFRLHYPVSHFSFFSWLGLTHPRLRLGGLITLKVICKQISPSYFLV